jgi:hypothetical protein
MFIREKGIVLVAVIAFAVIFAIVGIALLALAEQEAVQTRIEHQKAEAFYFAEAGLAKMSEILQTPIEGNLNEVLEGSLDQGSYRVEIDTNQTPCYAISTGTSGTIQKSVRMEATFLASPFENAVFALNNSGTSWAFQLRGTGNPTPYGSGEKGGKDIISGNILVDGDVFMYEQSRVNPAPAPNTWGLNGDVDATGDISVLGSARVSGSTHSRVEEPPEIDMTAMDYAVNNTHNVSQIFQSAGVTSGHLPSGNELRDVFMKNPSDRSSECSSTSVDDYFLEPSSGFIFGTEKTGQTPLHAGDNRIYYVDGDVWVHSQQTYGFKMDGKVTIVATGDIHISDNIQYKDVNSLLGLVALGKYDGPGNLVSGGNIFFGDPRYGTMYVTSAMMFAANDFLFNTDAVSRRSTEPTSGFTVNGCFAAMNQVVINREWYTKKTWDSVRRRWNEESRAARYDTSAGQWIDTETGTALTTSESATVRHYQMIVNYDDRVRSKATCPPGLPRGGTKIFGGFSNWEEL